MSAPRISYLICTNPRSGSWLLAEALRATGVAGRPEEYFNPSLRPLYLRDLHLPLGARADEVLGRVLQAGTTDNGIFGAKVHYLQYASLIDFLREATGDPDADEVAVLTAVFPGLTLVHHDRRDRTAQALSWHRALATGNWWHVQGHRDVRTEEGVELDVEHVAGLERRLRADDAAWEELFARSALPVVRSTYEGLLIDHEERVRDLVVAVGGPAAAEVPAPALVRQADRTTVAWRRQYTRAVRARQRPLHAAASIVVVSHDEGPHLLRTVSRLRGTTPTCTEIVVVDDGSTDGSVEKMAVAHPDVHVVRPPRRLGVAGARNAGAEAVSGDVLVFSDAHVDPVEGWLPPLLDALQDVDVGEVGPTVCDMHDRSVRGFGFTWPDLSMRVAWARHAAREPVDTPFICGCFLAMRRETFDDLGGFDDGLIRWGSEDAELSLCVWRRGLRCVVVPESEVAHLFRPTFGYAVEWGHTLHNIFRVASVHFPPELLAATLEHFLDHTAFPSAVALLDLAEVQQRRRRHERLDRYDGRWFLERFGIAA